MSTTFFEAKGVRITPSSLSVKKAIQLANFLETGGHPWGHFVECRKSDVSASEIVVLEVDIERAQDTVHDVRSRERISVEFFEADNRHPVVLALREDFPAVPHINVETTEFPRSLCLYENDYADLKRDWTALRYLERIREWFKLTSKGALHDPNQPLEPLLPASPYNLIITADLISTDDNLKPLYVYGWEDGGHQTMFVSRALNLLKSREPEKQGIAIPIQIEPQTATFIHRIPGTLQDLHDFLASASFDLVAHLRSLLEDWMRRGGVNALLQKHLWMIISVPMKRTLEGPVETTSTWAFAIPEPLQTIGEKLGIWQRQGKELGYVIGQARENKASELPICLFNPIFEISRKQASLLNGDKDRFAGKIVGIGMGALGSQVFDNLTRSGFGEWVVIDSDVFLPHNGARHALPGSYAGWGKATAMSAWANHTLSGAPIAKAIVADVIDPKAHATEVEQTLMEADVILDMTASLSVARHLACDSGSKARRCSLFLSPSGSDLVVLAEPHDRSVPLDVLEMQYYRHLLVEPGLEEHLTHNGDRIRYARSCRDVTGVIPQDLVALHAAIATRSVKKICRSGEAVISIWKANLETMETKCIRGASAPLINISADGWEIRTDQVLLEKAFARRSERLPNETGGVLIGAFDIHRKIIYAVDLLPSPPDSVEWPTSYIRGYSGLRDDIAVIQERTLGNLSYIGEWHSHPRNHNSDPSGDDRAALAILAENMKVEAVPAVMLIVGDAGAYTFLIREAQ